MKYIQHEKLQEVHPFSQKIGEFIDWLSEEGVYLAEYSSTGEYMTPMRRSVTTYLAKFFEIDETALEKEKLDMLAELRN